MVLTIDERQIQLQALSANKQDAIRLAGQLLVDSDCIEAGYIASMLGREAVANTYLGNGIAIPHGLPKDRDLIKHTGVAVVQVPAGTVWNPGETARLIVGIAAKTDEHIDILRRLTRVLGDQDQVERLMHTKDPRDIIEALTGERPAAPPKVQDTTDYTNFFDTVVINKTGLHARPAAFFVDLAKKFQADIKVRHGDQVANGKILLELLQLGAEHGTTLRVSARGTDATSALYTLQQAMANGLGDEAEEPSGQNASVSANNRPSWVPRMAVTTLPGSSASSGLAIGPIRQHTQRAIVVEDQASDATVEGNRFQSALDAAHAELEKLYEEVKVRLGSGKAAIFRVHAELLNDATLIQQTITLIYQGHSAAWSWQYAINERVSQMKKLDDPILASRAIDISDVGQRVLRHLITPVEAPAQALHEPAILIAEDLTPSDTAELDPDTILGFCTARGGPTSHTAIIARSLGIPAIVGVGDTVLTIPDGTSSILDGSSGTLYLQPSESDIQEAREAQQQLQREQDVANASRFVSATTTDGHKVEIAANINRATEAQQAIAAGAEGVGLMRTEFLFLARNTAPSEDEQFEAYRDMVQALAGRPLIIRTLDIGGDKEVPYLNLPHEDNSFLGMRGIRLCLARPELFLPQLRAIYRAAAYGPINVMFPMIATLEDFEQARAATEQVREVLHAPRLPLGIMIEVPSAAMMADHFAREVDFFSIGTNDLTQYTLAMDRLHPQLAKQADGLHPAVLRVINTMVQAAQKEGKWVGVCGGIAGDLKGAVLLTGLGVSELSVSIPSIATIKAHIRTYSFAEMQHIAQQALACRTATEVRSLL